MACFETEQPLTRLFVKCAGYAKTDIMNYLIILFTSLLVIANDNNKPECSFPIFKGSIKKKTLAYKNKMNLSSNISF